ncbi:LysR family transcriptional regulator [Streptomyces albus]|uniref:LysR family transcriptional regulator n=1 Tax=Streptomyces albus TaxID=1888 RepID=UPI0013B49B80|nr:LysR family transcriptional regulator [Streptomyces albus]QID34293.1 LysR family transcriptional regulator [Streptomyces albus]
MRPVRTLPLRRAPLAGEALDSWTEVMSAQLRVPMGELLVALGLRREDESPTNWAPWMTRLTPHQAEHVALATGIPPDFLHTMTLQHFDQRALELDRERRQVNGSFMWARGGGSGSRFCPDCLRKNGGRWPLTWRLGWSFVCLTHRRLLADFCPKCTSRHRKRPHPSHLIPSPGHCDHVSRSTESAPRTRCLHPLAETETMRFDAGHPALLAQQALLDLITTGVGAFGVYARDPQPAMAVLADMRGIARRVLIHMPAPRMKGLVPEELVDAHFRAREHNSALTSSQRRAPLDPGRAAPAYAETTAAGAVAAWSILGQADCRQAAPHMRELLDAIVDRGYWTSPTVTRNWGRHTSPLLEAVHLKTIAPTLWPNAALRYRTALPTPSLPTATASQLTARARKIPGLIWPLWAVRLNPHPQVREHLAAALAASLLLINSRLELPDAVKKLGNLISQPNLTHVLQALRDDAHYEGIQLALIQLAAYLDSHDVPIDYGRRRRLDYTTLLPESEWIALCRRTLTEPGAGTRHQVARCYLFEKISGLPHTRIPAPPRDSPNIRNSRVRFPYVLTPEASAELDQIGRTFLDRNRLDNEPLTWQPPAELLDGLALPRADPGDIDLADLHRRVRAGQTSTSIADELGTDLRTLRYVLDQHPAPATKPTVHGTSRGLKGLHAARQMISKEQLEHAYVQQNLPFLTIQRETGINRKALAALADEYGIPRRPHRPRGTLDRAWLHEQYVVQRRTLDDIGQETGMSGTAVGARAREYGIPTQNNRQPKSPRQEFTSAPEVLRPALGNSYALRRLRVFIQGIRYPTLIEACQTHGIRPPTLTTQLKRLEEDLGGPLLIRAGRGRQLELTALGHEVVRAVENWAHTLADQSRETWDRATVRHSHQKKRKARPRPTDAPGVDGFPLLLQPAVRTFAGRHRLHRFLQAAAYPTLAAFCRDVGISPSALTPQIQQLERDLQGQLLIRGQCGRRMRLTEFGEKVLAVARPYTDLLATL